jgi:ABC-2 type transport system ATP-binding protein
MKQRLGLAAAMLSDPDLLILDEPANGLDPAGMVALRETLRWVTAQGKTVLISSHLLDEVEQLADVVGIIDQGRLLREGPLEELLRDAGQVKVRVPVADMARAAAIIRGIAGDKQLFGTDSGPQAGWFQVGLDPARIGEVNRALAEAGVFATGLETGSDLETVFLQLTHAAAVLAVPGEGAPAPLPPPSSEPPPSSVPPA